MLWYGNFMIKPSFHVLGGLQRWQFRAVLFSSYGSRTPTCQNPSTWLGQWSGAVIDLYLEVESRSPPKPSNTYQIYHSHSTSNNFNHPPLYIQINIDNSGAIIRPSAETIPGVALCSCQHSTNVNLAKQIFFLLQANFVGKSNWRRAFSSRELFASLYFLFAKKFA